MNWKVVLVVVTATLVGGYIGQWARHLEARGRIEAAEAQRDSVIAVATDLLRRDRIRDSVTAAETERLERERRAAEEEADAQRRRANGIAGRLRESLTAEQREQLDSLTAAHAAAIVAKDNVITTLEARERLLVAQVASKDSAIAVVQDALRRSQDIAQFWEREAKPSLGGQIRVGLPWALGGALVGSLVTLLATG